MKNAMRIVIKVVINILLVALLLWGVMMLFVGISLLLNGSFEILPTEEEMEKALIGGGLFTVLGLIAEVVSVAAIYLNNKRK